MDRFLKVGLTTLVAMLVLTETRAGGEDSPKVVLPEKAVGAIDAAFPGAKITKVKREKGDVEMYEASFTCNGKEGDAVVTADGTILSTEAVIDVDDIPAPALRAIVKASKGAVMTIFEVQTILAEVGKNKEIVKLEKPVILYEVALVRGKKKGEVSAKADGTIVESPSWSDLEKTGANTKEGDKGKKPKSGEKRESNSKDAKDKNAAGKDEEKGSDGQKGK